MLELLSPGAKTKPFHEEGIMQQAFYLQETQALAEREPVSGLCTALTQLERKLLY